MANESGEVILVTGGSGFIGQHIIRVLLQKKDELNIKEIRSVDLNAFKNTIDDNHIDIRTFVGDLSDKASVEDAFRGVNTVFHCAALVCLQYPTRTEDLERNNVDSSRAVVELCIKHNIERLIYTSCGSVCLIPFKGSSSSVIVNQTEAKAMTPKFDPANADKFDKQFLVRGYASTKMRAENIILGANGALLNNQTSCLVTAAIRPPFVYGEGDNHFMTNLLTYLSRRNYVYPRIAGPGGKQQVCYAGNVAWGHICLYKTLKTTPKAIAGLPVFITDESPLNDFSRFANKLGLVTGKFKVKRSAWSVSHMLFFFLATMIELFIKLLAPIKKITLQYSIRSLSSLASSLIFFNRLRAAIHIDYEPLIDENTALEISGKWYGKFVEENLAKGSKIKTS